MDNTCTVPVNSLQTEDDYSFISRVQGPSLQAPYLCDRETANLPYTGNNELPSSPFGNGIVGEHDNVITPYHALQTAYDHMKRRYSETVEIKNSLQRRLKAVNSGTSLNQSTSSSQFMSATHESEVAKAWEAYSDKCKECEKLRDDLRVAEQKAVKSQMDARDMTFREDMLRAKSQQDEYKTQLLQAEMGIRDHKDKLEMAREDLQKEKEYTEMVRKSAEERHHEMNNTITSLQEELRNEDSDHMAADEGTVSWLMETYASIQSSPSKNLSSPDDEEKKQKNQEFIKELEKQRKIAQDALEKRESAHKEEICKLEGRVYNEQDERSKTEQRLVELERYIQSSGIPLSLSLIQQQKLEGMDFDRDSNSTSSEVDAAELVKELRSLTDEINFLKQKASSQSSMISQIYENPRIQESMSLSCNGFDTAESINVFHPPPAHFTQMTRSTDGSSSQLSFDKRLIVEKSPMSSYESSVRQVGDEPHPAGLSTLAVSRQIHSVETQQLSNSERKLPQKIDIPAMPVNLSDAFTNIRLHKESGDLQTVQVHDVPEHPTSFYSALTETTGPLGDASHVSSKMENSSYDSGTNSSNADTLVEGGADLPEADKQRFVPPPSTNDRPPLRYGTLTYGNQPAAGSTMQAIWPSAGKNVAGSNLTPLWPPGSLGSGNLSSFDVISAPSDSSSESETASKAQEFAEYLQKSGAREFRVQPVTRSLPREPSYPHPGPTITLKHPSVIPANRARLADSNQVGPPSSSAASRPWTDRRPPAVEQEESGDERAFMAAPDKRMCPVCREVFGSSATESYMQRHINGHFSEDDMETTAMP